MGLEKQKINTSAIRLKRIIRQEAIDNSLCCAEILGILECIKIELYKEFKDA